MGRISLCYFFYLFLVRAEQIVQVYPTVYASSYHQSPEAVVKDRSCGYIQIR